MCLKKSLFRSIALALCLVVFSSTLCSASSVTYTAAQKQQLMQNFDSLDRKLEILGQNSEKSARELLAAEEKLARQDERLERQETLLLRYENVLKATDERLKRQEDSIERANKLLQEERKAHKAELRKKDTEKMLYGIAGIVVGVVAAKLLGN